MNKLLTLLTMVLLASPGFVRAGESVVKDSLEGNAISSANPLSVQSAYYTHAASVDAENRTMFRESSYALVRLSYPGTAATQPDGSAQVSFDVDYQVEVNDAFESRSVSNRSLQLNLSGSAASDVAYLQIKGASAADLSINDQGTDIPAGWDGLKLELILHNRAFTPLDKVADIPALYNEGSTADGNLKITWDSVAAAEYYELEWTYVSNQGPEVGQTLTPAEIEVDRALFRNNSSRVVLSDTTYEVPLVYEEGVILYRVRAVGKTLANNHPVTAKTAWSAPDNLYSKVSDYDADHYFVYQGHEPRLNWQSTISYAEEGKHKVVINYHDGSQRKRQSVTRINSDERAVVGEQLYDYNGRKVIDALPAPVTENSLGYYPHFNVPEGGSRMEKQLYDSTTAGEGCKVAAPAFATSDGASQYYSSENDFADGSTNKGDTLLNKDLLPDAGKYPYRQTVYTPDNTGRVKAQSGVGAAYNIKSPNKTEYLYSTPQQPELTRLFGEQVGYKDHYKKETVIDPNGQTTVKYKNPEGKVVATALAGDTPDNVEPLEGDKTKTISTDLLANDSIANTINTENTGRVMNYAFAVTSENQYNFTYTGSIGTYEVTCSNPEAGNQIDFEVDPVLDLELSLIDECGNAVFTTIDTAFSAGSPLSLPEEVTLSPGEYTINKELIINEASLEAYWQEYKNEEGTCVLTDDHFIDSALANLDTAGCGLSCDQCYAEIDSLDQELLDNGFGGLTAREERRMRRQCDARCEERPLDCRGGLIGMRGDMGPGGQYGKIRREKVEQASTPTASIENGNPELGDMDVTVNDAGDDAYSDGSSGQQQIDPSPYPLSIYNPYNQLFIQRYLREALADSIDQASWRHPIAILPDDTNGYASAAGNHINQILETPFIADGLHYEETNYHKPDGEVFYVTVFQQPDGTYEPAVDTAWAKAAGDFVTVDETTGEYKVPVKYLRHLEDFHRYWNNNWNWSNYLLPYHPEFQYYIDCMADREENIFDYRLIRAETIDQAQQEGFIDNNGNIDIIAQTQENTQDVFLKNNAAAHDYMWNKYNIYDQQDIDSDPDEETLSMAQKATVLVNCPEGKNSGSCVPQDCDNGEINTTAEWNAFKALYFNEKQPLQRNETMRRAVDSQYYNGCIGHADYLSNDDDYFRTARPTRQEVTVSEEVCDEISSPFGTIVKWNCHTETYTVFRTEYNIPYMNPEQVCWQGRAGLFAGKQQRFDPQMPSESGNGTPGESCDSIVYNEDTQDTVHVSVPCEGQEGNTAENMQEADLEARRYIYNSCGLCPLAHELETLIEALSGNELLFTDGHDLTCSSGNNPVKLGTVFRDNIFANIGNAGAQTLFYRGETTPGGNYDYTGEIYNVFSDGSIDQVRATIGMNVISDDGTPPAFTAIEHFCCMQVQNSDNQGINTFTMDAYTATDTVTIQGTLEEFNLAPCTIPPKCVLTTGATRLNYFLNTLTRDGEIAGESGDELPGKDNDLVTGGSDMDLVPANTGNISTRMYTDAVRRLIGKDQRDEVDGYVQDMTPYQATWNSTIDNTQNPPVIQGTFTYDQDPSSGGTDFENRNIWITGLSGTQANTELVEFTNLRPVPYSQDNQNVYQPCMDNNGNITTGTCNLQYYKADAVLESASNGRYVETVRIYAPASSLLPVACNGVQAAETEN